MSEYIEWCRNMFDTLLDGAAWAVPRNGFIFTRKGETLVLTMRMPYDPGMPLTAEEFADYQKNEYELIKREFGYAGIEVRDDTSKEGQ